MVRVMNSARSPSWAAHGDSGGRETRMSAQRRTEWEVLPPEQPPKRLQFVGKLYEFLARVMDELVHVPGTRFRFGLNPVIGLIPGIGDAASALISALCLIYAACCGIPRITLVRMSLNIVINEVVGIVPVAGDAFSFAFWFQIERPGIAAFFRNTCQTILASRDAVTGYLWA